MMGWSSFTARFTGAILIGCPSLWFGTPPARDWVRRVALPAFQAYIGENPPATPPPPLLEHATAAAPAAPALSGAPVGDASASATAAHTPAIAAPVVANGPTWASVCAVDAPLYGREGNLVATLTPGEAVAILGVRVNHGEEVAIVRRPDRPGDERGLMRTRDLLLRADDRTRLPAALLALYADEARTLAALDQARTMLAQEHARAHNPHATAYTQAAERYRALLARAQSVKAEWENAAGERRAALGDELRLMKNEEAQLAVEYKRLRQAYDAAMANLPAAPSANALTTELEIKLEDVRARIAEGVPVDL